MSDNAARRKIPLPDQVMGAKPQPPPLRRRARRKDRLSESGSREIMHAAEQVTPPLIAPEPPQAKQPFSFADLPDDEDKTAAFEVPEELLRRSRLGREPVAARTSEIPLSDRTQAYHVGFADDDRAPDSNANTAPPPAPEPALETSPFSDPALSGLGRAFEQDPTSEASGPKLALVADYAQDLLDDEESGEFTRIGHEDELRGLSSLKQAKVPNVIVSDEQTSLEATSTKVRAKQNVQPAQQSNRLLWAIIAVLMAATSVLAALLLKAV